MATQTKKPAAKSSGKSPAAAKTAKTTTVKAAGAGAALADRSKDAPRTSTKPAAGKPATKTAPKPAKAASKPAPAKAAAAKSASPQKKPSLVKRVARSVKATATGAVELAASVVGMGEKKSSAKKG